MSALFLYLVGDGLSGAWVWFGMVEGWVMVEVEVRK